MMYGTFRHGVRSRTFAIMFDMCARRNWDHWDALRMALSLSRP